MASLCGKRQPSDVMIGNVSVVGMGADSAAGGVMAATSLFDEAGRFYCED